MDLERAAEEQFQLASKLILEWSGGDVNFIAGADFGYDLADKKIGVSIVVFKFPELKIVEVSRAIRKVEFPYVPGYLSLREGPAFLEAFREINHMPDITLVDGNGIAHPRKMGLASFVGVLLDIATIGCAKKSFFRYTLPSEHRGAFTPIKNEGNEKVGMCLRTRVGVKPIFVSPGHKIDFRSARSFVLSCSKFRIPEPIREAHMQARMTFRGY